ncbi:MAG: hypothetical protein JW986_10225 [Methanotrichaceae archaeon]|nr:hypothetical protein [Methanotrichaceae archaeon]
MRKSRGMSGMPMEDLIAGGRYDAAMSRRQIECEAPPFIDMGQTPWPCGRGWMPRRCEGKRFLNAGCQEPHPERRRAAGAGAFV